VRKTKTKMGREGTVQYLGTKPKTKSESLRVGGNQVSKLKSSFGNAAE
jgi:hypothetical protein